MSSITVQELDQLNAEIFKQREKIETMKEEVSKEQEILGSLEAKAVAALEELNRSNYKSDAGSISIQEVYRVKNPATPEDREAFFGYLKERGIFDQLITINSNTLNSWFKEQWEIAEAEGRGMDFAVPGISQPTLFKKLYVRKGNT